MTNSNVPEKFPNFVIFQTETGKVNIEVYFHDETLWLTQKKIAELFERDRSVITRHLKNIFNEGELDENVVCANFAHTTQHGAIEGKTQEKEVTYYNLRAITAVGYRVNSHRATEFRKWATEILHEYIIKGFVMDDERLAVVLFERVKANASIDWTIKESVKAKLKVIVKRTLRQFGYPPDMQKLATETVLKQAEMLANAFTMKTDNG